MASSRLGAVRRYHDDITQPLHDCNQYPNAAGGNPRSEEHTSELQSRENRVCRPLLEKKNHDQTAPPAAARGHPAGHVVRGLCARLPLRLCRRTARTAIYPLSLRDALPILSLKVLPMVIAWPVPDWGPSGATTMTSPSLCMTVTNTRMPREVI